jgi:signal transduction histidine kinase
LQGAFKSDWPRNIRWARVLLAGLAFPLAYPIHPPLYFFAILAAYFAYALVFALRRRAQLGTLGLLALFADTVYFLILASQTSGPILWLSIAFYLYLLAEALVFHGTVEVVIVAGVTLIYAAVIADGARQIERPVIVGGILAYALAVSRKHHAREAEAMAEELENARKGAEKARELERQRIASDFHDGPLQSFISLQMRLEILRKLMERDLAAGLEDLRELQALAQSQVRDLRAFLHSMRPVDLEGNNLVASARRTAETFQKESGIPVTFIGANAPVGLPQEMTTEVLQMLREALANVQKHAGATRVAVGMEKADRALEISVDDNGHGFNFAGTYTLEELELLRLGPASLKRRARSLNADLILESRPGRGAGLKFRVPLQ